MIDTGKKLTEEQIQSVKATLNTPLIAIHTGMPESPQEQVHRYALAAGLPEISGHYGADLRTGTIYRV